MVKLALKIICSSEMLILGNNAKIKDTLNRNWDKLINLHLIIILPLTASSKSSLVI